MLEILLTIGMIAVFDCFAFELCDWRYVRIEVCALLCLDESDGVALEGYG